ncbi:hypothetical protein HOR55_gp38 [Ralstonia phage RS-PII-1]|uniref:Uncharacterized protein n=1 Tax=Ralstonia phage RS-PII-1 TaxID=1932892 RepID=A0A1L7DQI3_9CAUD|nr:hypothetical protein HOR55_gp38 [Ralstonia phage RS-PII-1]APU00325.1 hypothetical protein [Ralstonia phage RS-PII-1]
MEAILKITRRTAKLAALLHVQALRKTVKQAHARTELHSRAVEFHADSLTNACKAERRAAIRAKDIEDAARTEASLIGHTL